jgi:L-aspartate oxidase
MIKKFDFLIIGSGVAGMSYALKVSQNSNYSVALVCKTTLEACIDAR